MSFRDNRLRIPFFSARVLRGILALGWALVAPAGAGTPVDPMVPLFHKWQMASAPALVAKAADLGHDRVQFCVTLQAELKQDNQVSSIGLYRDSKPPGGENAFFPFDTEIKAELSGYLAACFAKAVERGMDIAVLLHLNPYGPNQEWRNSFDFDPLAPIAGFSYQDGFFRTVIEALENTVPPDHPVEISVQGEMGTSVFRYPDSWRKLIEAAKSRGKLKNVIFGISFNFQGVAGKAAPGTIDPEAMKRLWSACDFTGISMYQAVSHPTRASDFDLAVGLFAGELHGLGCPLPPNKPLHFVEVGIGGGGLSPKDWQPDIPAENPADAARAPYLGNSYPSEVNPWSNPSLRELRAGFYKGLCGYLAETRARYPVKRAYLWSFGSWDPLGLEEDRFADPEIIRLIKTHNQNVRPGSR